MSCYRRYIGTVVLLMSLGSIEIRHSLDRLPRRLGSPSVTEFSSVTGPPPVAGAVRCGAVR
eukprot:COSAG03_NODE_2362_length_2845_cov_20.143481_4_plen_61_part_00